jgi:hypothetical protein
VTSRWTPLEQAISERQDDSEDGLIHHSDRGVQYLSIRYTERLAEAGIEPSVGSRGDSYDNALAETIIGLFKTEVIRRGGPWRGHENVEFATLKWVWWFWWFNHHRLLAPIGYVPPVEYEEAHYPRSRGSDLPAGTQLTESPMKPGRFSTGLRAFIVRRCSSYSASARVGAAQASRSPSLFTSTGWCLWRSPTVRVRGAQRRKLEVARHEV